MLPYPSVPFTSTFSTTTSVDLNTISSCHDIIMQAEDQYDDCTKIILLDN